MKTTRECHSDQFQVRKITGKLFAQINYALKCTFLWILTDVTLRGDKPDWPFQKTGCSDPFSIAVVAFLPQLP